MTTSTDTPNPDRSSRTFSSTARLFVPARGTHGVATSHEGDRFVIAIGRPERAVHTVEHGGVVARQPGEPLASAGLKRSDVLVLAGELQRFLLETGGPAQFSGSLTVIPPTEAEPAVVEQLETDLTPEQDARVSALHQAAAVMGRLIEVSTAKVGPEVDGTVSVDLEDVLTLARWVISGDAAVEPVLVDRAELAADR